MDVINFLQAKGYEIKTFSYILPANEELLISEPEQEVYTFTATKGNEIPSFHNVYLNIFEKEIKKLLEINRLF